MCCAGRCAPSQCETITGPSFSSLNKPDQERTPAYRDSSGSESPSGCLLCYFFRRLGGAIWGIPVETVSGQLDGERRSVTLRTGHAEFDALNAKLGLWAVRPFSSAGVAAMYFRERLNIDAARRAYLAMEGVTYVELDALLGDGSGIEATKSQGIWYVVFRKAWGDCPAGCIYEDVSFFTVDDSGVERIEPTRAKSMAGFSELAVN